MWQIVRMCFLVDLKNTRGRLVSKMRIRVIMWRQCRGKNLENNMNSYLMQNSVRRNDMTKSVVDTNTKRTQASLCDKSKAHTGTHTKCMNATNKL